MKIKAILSDLSGTFLFVKDKSHTGTLNSLHAELSQNDPHYDFYTYFEIDQSYVELMKELKSSYKMYMFTSGYIQNHPQLLPTLQEVFEIIFNQDSVGSDKNMKESYEHILNTIGLNPREVLFIDDNQDYRGAAQEGGLNTFPMTNTYELRAFLKEQEIL